jgi:hypothetical protein
MAQVLVLYGERTRAVTQPQPQALPLAVALAVVGGIVRRAAKLGGSLR